MLLAPVAGQRPHHIFGTGLDVTMRERANTFGSPSPTTIARMMAVCIQVEGVALSNISDTVACFDDASQTDVTEQNFCKRRRSSH